MRSPTMYQNLKDLYLWNSMKKGFTEFVANCPSCQQVKVKHQRPGGMVQNIKHLVWKWDLINTEFITSLQRSRRQYDSILLFVDRMTK